MFALDPVLARDTKLVGALNLSRILLMNNQDFPWIILVPERANMVELTDLSLSERTILMSEIATISDVLTQTYRADKINVAALGNQVKQLHIHVIARFETDKMWPNPVWGARGLPYTNEALAQTLDGLQQALSISASA